MTTRITSGVNWTAIETNDAARALFIEVIRKGAFDIPTLRGLRMEVLGLLADKPDYSRSPLREVEDVLHGEIDERDTRRIDERDARVEAWKSIADAYSTSWGQPVDPSDCVDYPRQIMSLLSDAQEMAARGNPEGANDHINAAKMMLDRMMLAARLKERAENQPGFYVVEVVNGVDRTVGTKVHESEAEAIKEKGRLHDERHWEGYLTVRKTSEEAS